jgi:hypothetical protein
MLNKLLFCTIFSKSKFIFKEFQVYQQIIDHQAYPPRHALGLPAPQNAKKSLKAPCCHKTMWAWKSAQHFPHAKTPYSASFSVPEGAGCWSRRSTLVGLAALNPKKLSTAQRSYPQKIYENIAFP